MHEALIAGAARSEGQTENANDDREHSNWRVSASTKTELEQFGAEGIADERLPLSLSLAPYNFLGASFARVSCRTFYSNRGESSCVTNLAAAAAAATAAAVHLSNDYTVVKFEPGRRRRRSRRYRVKPKRQSVNAAAFEAGTGGSVRQFDTF